MLMKFGAIVAGTGPNYADPFSIKMSISEQQVAYNEVSTGEAKCHEDGQ